nr:MAG TPA: hypothetical protein [Caudoviricetes sp.]
MIAERLTCAGKSNARLRRRPVFRQFKPTPADCLPPRRFAIFVPI